MSLVERIFKRNKIEIDPVSAEISRVEKALEHGLYDPYSTNLYSALLSAREHGWVNDLARLACLDFARNRDPVLLAEDWREMGSVWQERFFAFKQSHRSSRNIDMKLDPIYFYLILKSQKYFEGRAYDPSSPKRYEDIRPGDIITFSLNPEAPNLNSECVKYNLMPENRMICSTGTVIYAPTVNGVFEELDSLGYGFQPTLTSEVMSYQIPRVATYYAFPGYEPKITQYGFVGIEVRNPQLIQ